MSNHGLLIPSVSKRHGNLGFDIHRSSKMMHDSGSCLSAQVEEGKSYCGLKIEPLFAPRKY